MAQQLRILQSLWAMERRLANEGEFPLQTQLEMIRDAGYEPVYAGGLENARVLEDSLKLLMAISQGGLGQTFYRIAPPGQL